MTTSLLPSGRRLAPRRGCGATNGRPGFYISLVPDPQITGPTVVAPTMPIVDARALLLLTVALLTVYTVGIGGTTAAAIGAWDAWRRHERGAVNLDPQRGDVVLVAPALPRFVRVMRVAGWIAFAPALVL